MKPSVTILILSGLGVLALILSVVVYPRSGCGEICAALTWSLFLLALGVVLLLGAWAVAVVSTIARRHWVWLALMVVALAALVAFAAFNANNPDVGNAEVGQLGSQADLVRVALIFATPMVVGVYAVVGLFRRAAVTPGPGKSAAYANTRSWLGALGAVAALALLGTAIAQILLVATTAVPDRHYLDLSGFALLRDGFGLVGVPVTLAAAIFSLARARKDHQWRWVAAILIGTALPLPAAAAAFTAVYPAYYEQNELQMTFAWVFGLACAPLAASLYSMVGLRNSAGAVPLPSRSAAYADTCAWLGGAGTVVALALTLVASSFASNGLPLGAPQGRPALKIGAYQGEWSSGTPINGPVDCRHGLEGLKGVYITISNPGGGVLRWVARTDDPDVQLDSPQGVVYGTYGVNGAPDPDTPVLGGIYLIGTSQRNAITLTFQSNAGGAHLVLQCLSSP